MGIAEKESDFGALEKFDLLKNSSENTQPERGVCIGRLLRSWNSRSKSPLSRVSMLQGCEQLLYNKPSRFLALSHHKPLQISRVVTAAAAAALDIIGASRTNDSAASRGRTSARVESARKWEASHHERKKNNRSEESSQPAFHRVIINMARPPRLYVFP